MRTLLFSLCSLLATTLWADDFVTVRDGRLFFPENPGQPAYFVGVTMAKAPLMLSHNDKASRQQLKADFDRLQDLGVNVVSVSLCGQGHADTLTCHDEKMLSGLDVILAEAERRHIYIMVCLTAGECPYCHLSHDDETLKLPLRRNTVTRKTYQDTPALMAWQLSGHTDDILSLAAQLKEADQRHLIAASAGIEGFGKNSRTVCSSLLAGAAVDMLSLDLLPTDIGWASTSALHTAMPHIYLNTEDVLAQLNRLNTPLVKPIILGRVGYERDKAHCHAAATTRSRDALFSFVVSHLAESRSNATPLSGACFYGWDCSPTANVSPNGELAPHRAGQYTIFRSDQTSLSIIASFHQSAP